jgi:bis(5'-adenosyl)-triphosphatase
MSRRVVPRLNDLTAVEYADLWCTVRRVQEILQASHESNQKNEEKDEYERRQQQQQVLLAFNVAVQDGVAAGQSVPHVHVHILPRVVGDYTRNDDVYRDLEQWAPRRVDSGSGGDLDPQQPTSAGSTRALDVPDDDQRRDRTAAEMAEEADMYRRIANATMKTRVE